MSAFNFPGNIPEAAFHLCIEGRIELATSNVLLAEFARILADKFDWTRGRVARAVDQVARVGTVVEPGQRVTVVAADPDDDRVLEAALEAEPHLICSGDKHLLRLVERHAIRIVYPATLVEEFESR